MAIASRCVRRTKIKNLKAIHNHSFRFIKIARLCSKNKDKKSESNSQLIPIESLPSMLCSKNKDKKSESNSQRLQFNMSGCIPYRRRPPPVRNMRAVLKKASWGTRRVFGGTRCKKQASGVQRRHSVPETPFSGTEQAKDRTLKSN